MAFIKVAKRLRHSSFLTHHFSLIIPRCRSEPSTREGIALIRENQFDAIVSDYQLSDGVAVSILNFGLQTPIVITTGTGNEEIAVLALESCE